MSFLGRTFFPIREIERSSWPRVTKLRPALSCRHEGSGERAALLWGADVAGVFRASERPSRWHRHTAAGR
jgi:hypothetical protein